MRRRTHDWLIDEREYARHESRRGRRHAFAHLDPRRTALVVVDLVPFFVEQNEYALGVVPRVNALATALRAAGGTVAWVVPGPSRRTAVDREFYGDEVAATYAASGGSGPVRERLWHELDVHDGTDLLVEKSAPSAFFPGRSPLPELLSERGTDTVVVTGTVTNVCCESTVRDASTLGYRVVLVADACAARNDQDHNASLHVVYRSFGDVRPAADVLDLIGS